MGSKTSSSLSSSVQEGMLANQTALVGIAEQQAENAQQLYNLTEPGLVQAEDYEQTLAAGDPAAILRAVAPTAQASAETAAGARSNILAGSPAGGEKNLALEATDIQRAGTISKAVSGATTGAYQGLAQLGGSGVQLANQAAGTAISGYGTADQGLASLGQLQIEQQQVQAQEKGSTLGSLTGLAGDVATAGGEAGGFSKLFSNATNTSNMLTLIE